MDARLLPKAAQRQLIGIGGAAFHPVDHLLECRQRLFKFGFRRMLGGGNRFTGFIHRCTVVSHQDAAKRILRPQSPVALLGGR